MKIGMMTPIFLDKQAHVESLSIHVYTIGSLKTKIPFSGCLIVKTNYRNLIYHSKIESKNGKKFFVLH